MTAPVRPDDDFLVFGAPRIEQPEIEEVVDSLETGWLGTGPKTKRFEEDFAEYKGASNAVAVHSCTAALHLSLLASDIGEGDEVITTPMTFCATVNTIIHAGATPVLADVDRDTMNIDPEAIKEQITDDTAAILPVHFAGRMCEMEAIDEIADDHDLTVIEDAAHAIETERHGRKAGTVGDFGCFSFYATKNVVTGEGGMILTEDDEVAERLDRLALHGMSRDAWKRYSDEGYDHYQVVDAGWKYNMMDLQAALGIHQLQRVDDYWKRREEIWSRYDRAFAELPIETPTPPARDTRHAYHLYTVLVDEEEAGIERDAFLNGIEEQNVGTGVHYLSIPEHPYYQETFGWQPDDWPNAAEIGRRTVSLPLAPNLSDDDVADVIESVERVVG